MAAVKFADNAYGTLGGSLASTASSIAFTSGHGARFPAVAAGECLYVCLLNSNNVLEEIQITTHTAGADSADVVRAVGGTTAKAWNAGDRIEARISSTAIANKFSDPLNVTSTAQSYVAGPILTGNAITSTGFMASAASLRSWTGTAPPSGGTVNVGLLMSNVSSFGVFFGDGPPTLNAAKGSLYLRRDGSGATDRAYINTDGGGTWTALVTAG